MFYQVEAIDSLCHTVKGNLRVAYACSRILHPQINGTFGTFGHTSKKDEEAEILSTYLGQYSQTALTLSTGIQTLPDDLSRFEHELN